jgi:ribose-phosphate pyrophosphokinase
MATSAYDFANGEIYVRYEDSVRGSDAFVIQSHTAPINTWVMETLIMIDALKRASAKRITVVTPFYPYSRQDKKHRGREPISARLISDLFERAGADRIMSVDLHTAQIQGSSTGRWTTCSRCRCWPTTSQEKYATAKFTVVSPDSGRLRVAERWTDRLGGCPLAFIHKTRDPLKPNEVVAHRVVGEVAGRSCILVDDMIDTGSTIVSAARQLKDAGRADVIVVATHGILSGPAIDRLKNAPINEVVLTNTLPIPPERQIDGDDGAVHRPAHRPRHPRGLRGRLRHQPLRRSELARRAGAARSGPRGLDLRVAPARASRGAVIDAARPVRVPRLPRAYEERPTVADEVRIQAEPRTEFGKGGARRTRRAGKIPAVLYGHGTDPRHIALPAREFSHAIKGGANTLLTLQLDGSSELALPKAIQRHPIRGDYEHVDLLLVRRGEKVTVEVPVTLTGEADRDGLVDQQLVTLTVEAEATNIPDHFEVSIEGLDVGDNITAGAVPLPDGTTLDRRPGAGRRRGAGRPDRRAARRRAGRRRGRGRHRARGADRAGRGGPGRPRGVGARRRVVDGPISGRRARESGPGVPGEPAQRRLHGPRPARRAGRRPVLQAQGRARTSSRAGSARRRRRASCWPSPART